MSRCRSQLTEIIRRAVPLAGEPTTAFRGHDATQRSLEVRLVFEVQSVQLLRRLHVAHVLGDDVQLVLTGGEPVDGFVDVDVAAAKRIGELAQLGEGIEYRLPVIGRHLGPAAQALGRPGERFLPA